MRGISRDGVRGVRVRDRGGSWGVGMCADCGLQHEQGGGANEP